MNSTREMMPIISVVTFCLIIGSNTEFVNAQPVENDIKKTLLSFYTAYIKEQCVIKPNYLNIDSIMLRYCTSRCISNIEDLFEKRKLDYDPFLNAQDISCEVISTLQVSIISIKTKGVLCKVEYRWPIDSNESIKVYLLLIKEMDGYKIDEVLFCESDPLLSD